jgi:hypothetical protein
MARAVSDLCAQSLCNLFNMGDHFHTSLHELRLQLDLMNSRTASTLNKSRQRSNMLTSDSSTVGQSPSVTTDNMQQIKHIGATVGTLAKQQEDRFQAFEQRLDCLADKLDDLALANPQFTPPESPGLSDSASSHSDTPSISSHHSNVPRVLRSDLAPATIADVGGYFHPNCDQHGDSDQQYISDASTFVGRVNRIRQTKSITNIEVFLRGSALRWFHICLKSDGTHLFDMLSGEFDIGGFCDSLILLFGVPTSLASAARIKTLPLAPSWMHSEVVEDYVFPALEYLRPQEDFSGVGVAVSKALALYNQSFAPCTVSSEIFDCTTDLGNYDYSDLQFILGDLRRSELEQKFDRTLTKTRKVVTDAASARVATECTKNGPVAHSKAQQDPVFASTGDYGCKMSKLTSAKSHDNHWQDADTTRPDVKSTSSTVKMPRHAESEVATFVASMTEPYPPAPTAESCLTTPTTFYQLPPRDFYPASHISNVRGGTRIHVATQPQDGIPPMQNEATYKYSFADSFEGAGGVGLGKNSKVKFGSEKNDPSMPVSNKTANKFGVQPGCQP